MINNIQDFLLHLRVVPRQYQDPAGEHRPAGKEPRRAAAAAAAYNTAFENKNKKWLQQDLKLFSQFMSFLRPADICRPRILECS